jgi:hypothetical protein
LKHVQTCSFVDGKHVPGDKGLSCLHMFQLIQLK